jgi:hypothetical protein
VFHNIIYIYDVKSIYLNISIYSSIDILIVFKQNKTLKGDLSWKVSQKN